jgi:squalene synthase HpnC
VTREATPVSGGNSTRGAAIRACADGGLAGIDALSDQAAGENFPVALRILPRAYRRHLMAVYRFARLVDDIGDEPGPLLAGHVSADTAETVAETTGRAADRLRALDAVEEDLDRAFSSGATSPGSQARLRVVREVARTAADCVIPAEPFRMLIEANRQDQRVSRYATFGDLLGYCRLSANPVGRIVLHIFGAATAERERLSDLVCTALQLAEHWQDVAEDFARGRIYLPQEDLVAFGCVEGDLQLAAGVRTTPLSVRKLMRFETERAGQLLTEGAPLTGTLHGWARLAVAGYVAGGRATLAAIAAAGSAADSAPDSAPAGFDVLSVTARPGRARTAAGLMRAYLRGR